MGSISFHLVVELENFLKEDQGYLVSYVIDTYHKLNPLHLFMYCTNVKLIGIVLEL